jgi:rubrerythrin
MAPKVYEQLAALEEKGLAREVFITIAHQERDHKALLEKIKLNRCEI